MSTIIIDRGRGPELQGTRVTVFRVMDYVRGGDSPEQIAEELDLTSEQVRAALDYIAVHQSEVESAYDKILERVNQPNPPELEAGAAANWEELRHRILARTNFNGKHLVFKA